MRALIYILMAFLWTSCKSGSNSADSKAGENRNMVVIFGAGSGGEKIDFDTKNSFNSFIKEKYPNLVYENYIYGKDGEVEYCITSEGMKKKEFAQFVNDANEILAESSKVSVKENAECTHAPKN